MVSTKRYILGLNVVIIAGLCVIISGCYRQRPNNSQPGPIVSIQSIVGNVPVPQCTPSNGFDPTNIAPGVVRVLINESLDDLIGQNPPPRVKYSNPDSMHDYNDYQSNSTIVPCTSGVAGSCEQGAEIAPYNINLPEAGLPKKSQWVKVKFLIPLQYQYFPISPPVSSLNFYHNQDGQNVYAFTVPNSYLHRNICLFVNDINVTDLDKKSVVATLYVWYTYPPANVRPILPFSIVLLPLTGATGTPVVIDPKILNNG